jgi:hypothetical protein
MKIGRKTGHTNLNEGLQTISLSPMLAKASWEELLLHLVPGWQEKGTQLLQLKWPDNQITENEKIKKVPSWQEKGIQLLKKKVPTSTAKGANLLKLKITEIQNLILEYFEKVPSALQKGAKLFSRKSFNLNVILILTSF